jgi:hypothetical protein
MHTQRYNVSAQIARNNFLDRINYSNVYLLPCNNNARMLAAQARNGRRVQSLTGKGLLKRNVEREARRLQLYNRYIINLATDHIWNLRSTFFQRSQFINLANGANSINQNRVSRIVNAETLYRISQITIPQITSDLFANNLFGGTSFHHNQPLILPTGCLGSSVSFP